MFSRPAPARENRMRGEGSSMQEPSSWLPHSLALGGRVRPCRGGAKIKSQAALREYASSEDARTLSISADIGSQFGSWV